MTPPADARLRELAKIGARICHEDLFDRALNIDGEPTEGHENLSDGAQGFDSWGFERCPHPDCVLVRSAVSSSQTCKTCDGRGWVMRGESRDYGNGVRSGSSWNEACPDCHPKPSVAEPPQP